MEPTKDEIANYITAYCQRRGIKSVAVTGTMPDGSYFGGIMGGQPTHELMAAVCNVGRLWQYAREQMRGYLNHYEGSAP